MFMEAIKLFLTGGTFDKRYNEISEKCEFFTTHIHSMLTQSRNRLLLDIEELMLVDSADMTDEQRQTILSACSKTSSQRIAIAHGTSTLAQTADLLGNHIHDKTIVLFGAMIPYMLGNSDALFNLGAALTAAQILLPGVYITMNGKIFTWNNVQKQISLGEFIETLPR